MTSTRLSTEPETHTAQHGHEFLAKDMSKCGVENWLFDWPLQSLSNVGGLKNVLRTLRWQRLAWNQSPWQCLQRCSILNNFVTAHPDARALKVQLPQEAAMPKWAFFSSYSSSVVSQKFSVFLDESGWNGLRVLSYSFQCSIPKMASSRPPLDMLHAKHLTFVPKSIITVNPHMHTLSSSLPDWFHARISPLKLSHF